MSAPQAHGYRHGAHAHGRSEERIYIGPYIHSSASGLVFSHLRRPPAVQAAFQPTRTSTMANHFSTDTESSGSDASDNDDANDYDECGSGVQNEADRMTVPPPSRRRDLFAHQHHEPTALEVPVHRTNSTRVQTKWQRLLHKLSPSAATRAKAAGTFVPFGPSSLPLRPPVSPPRGMVQPTVGTSAGGTRWVVPPDTSDTPSIHRNLEQRIQTLSGELISARAQKAPVVLVSPPPPQRSSSCLSTPANPASNKSVPEHEGNSSEPQSPQHTNSSASRPAPLPHSLHPRHARTLVGKCTSSAFLSRPSPSPIECQDGWDDVIRRLSTAHGELSIHSPSLIPSPTVPRLRSSPASSQTSIRRSPSLPLNQLPEPSISPPPLNLSSSSPNALPPSPLHSSPSNHDTALVGPRKEVVPEPQPPSLPSLLQTAKSQSNSAVRRVSFASIMFEPSQPQQRRSKSADMTPEETALNVSRSFSPTLNGELRHHLTVHNVTSTYIPKEPTTHQDQHTPSDISATPTPHAPPNSLSPRRGLSDPSLGTILRRDRMLVRAEWTPLSPLPALWDELTAARVPLRAIGPWCERLVVLRHVGGGHEQLELWAPQRTRDKVIKGLWPATHPLGSAEAESLDHALDKAPAIGHASVQGLTRIQTILVGDKRVGMSLYSPIDHVFSVTISTHGTVPSGAAAHMRTMKKKTRTLNSTNDAWWASSMGIGVGMGGPSGPDATMQTNLLTLRRSGGGTKIYLFTPPSHETGLAWIWIMRGHLAHVGARMTSAVATSVLGPMSLTEPTMHSHVLDPKGEMRRGKYSHVRRIASKPVVSHLDVSVPDINVRVRIPVPANDTEQARRILGLVEGNTNQILGHRAGELASPQYTYPHASRLSHANGLGYRLLTPEVVRRIVSQTMLASSGQAPQDDAARWAALVAESEAMGVPLRLAWRIGARLEWLPEPGVLCEGETTELIQADDADPDRLAVVKGMLLATREHPKPKLELRLAFHTAHALPASLISRVIREGCDPATGGSPDADRAGARHPDLIPFRRTMRNGTKSSTTCNTADPAPRAVNGNGKGPVNQVSPASPVSHTDEQYECNDETEEPPGAEGYLWRVRPVTGTLTRMYAVVRQGRQFSCPLSRAFPPLPALLRLLDLTSQGPPLEPASILSPSSEPDAASHLAPPPKGRHPSAATAGTSGTVERRRSLLGTFPSRLGRGLPNLRSSSQRSNPGRMLDDVQEQDMTDSDDDAPTGWNAERAYLLDQLIRSLSPANQKIAEASMHRPVEHIAIPAMVTDLDRLLAELLRLIRQDILHHVCPSGPETVRDTIFRLKSIQRAYRAYEQHRQTLQLQNAEGFVDVSDVVQSGLMGGQVALSQINDCGGQEGLADAGSPEEKAKIQSFRQMEMVLANGQRVVLEAFSVSAAVRWVELLRAHTVYDRALAKVASSDLMRLSGFANTHAHHGRAWGEMSGMLAKLWTWCPIQACHAVRFMGPLFRKHSARAAFERRTYVLTRGMLTGFMITHSQKSARARLDAGIFHKRVSSFLLEGAYVYSGALALEWIPRHAQHAAPGASALAGGGAGGTGAGVALEDGSLWTGHNAGAEGRAGALVAQAQRVYDDGLQACDAEADCLFVIRYRLPRARAHRSDRVPPHTQAPRPAQGVEPDGTEATPEAEDKVWRPVGMSLDGVDWSGKHTASLVLLARSRAERDLWVKHIAWEVERIHRDKSP